MLSASFYFALIWKEPRLGSQRQEPASRTTCGPARYTKLEAKYPNSNVVNQKRGGLDLINPLDLKGLRASERFEILPDENGAWDAAT